MAPTKGKRDPADRMSPDERKEALAIVLALLARGRYKHEIKDVFRHNWGQGRLRRPLSARSVESLLRTARRQICEAAGASEEELRGAMFHCYRGILDSPAASDRVRLLAIDGLVKLMGLSKPLRLDLRFRNRDVEAAEKLARQRQKIVANPVAAAHACAMIEAIAEAEAAAKKPNGHTRLPIGLKELDPPKPPDAPEGDSHA